MSRVLLLLVALLMVFSPLDLARASGVRRDVHGLAYVALTTPQRKVAEDDSRFILWRDGNRLGKSFLLAWELIHRMRGTHPYKQTHPVPIKALVISVSLDQIIPLMEALWMLVPKDEVSDKCGFDPGRGLTGKPPRLVLDKGPGAGSVLSIATYKQGSTRIAGGEYQVVAMDEPPPETMFGEVQPRIFRSKGSLLVTMTPTPDMPDVGWLREKVEAEDSPWSEHNYGVREENCWIEGHPTPFATQAEIDEYAKGLLRVERAMRIDGAWEPLVEGRWVTNFTDDNVQAWRPLAGARLIVGIDHGQKAGKQAAVLMAVKDAESMHPRVWYWDETFSDGTTTPDQDAQAILEMLARNGLQYSDVDDWVGDRPTGDSKWQVSKTNTDLRRRLAARVGITYEESARINTPRKFSGSVTYGLRLMNGLFGMAIDEKPLAVVHPRCERLIEALNKFQGDRRDPLKDVLDAARYPTERVIRSRSATVSRLHF